MIIGDGATLKRRWGRCHCLGLNAQGGRFVEGLGWWKGFHLSSFCGVSTKFPSLFWFVYFWQSKYTVYESYLFLKRM